MEIFKKKLEYDEMLRNGVISADDYYRLINMLYSPKMAELGITDEIEFEELLRKEVFKEAILMLEDNTASSYREAIALLESLDGWGNSNEVISQCKNELVELEKIEEKERLVEEQKQREESLRIQEEKTKKRGSITKVMGLA